MSLRQPELRLFFRCRILPDQDLVRRWFDAVPPCPCTNPSCTGGVRWCESASKHLGREAYVLRIDERDQTVRVELTGRCNCKVWYPRLALEPVMDPDTATPPRFPVGTRVSCRQSWLPGYAWLPGTIDRVWWRREGWGNMSTYPYRIRVDDGLSVKWVNTPRDDDAFVRRLAAEVAAAQPGPARAADLGPPAGGQAAAPKSKAAAPKPASESAPKPAPKAAPKSKAAAPKSAASQG